MARKHSGGSHRSKQHRPPKFTVTCKGCGTLQVMNVRPPSGIELFCVKCSDAKRKAAAAPTTPPPPR